MHTAAMNRAYRAYLLAIKRRDTIALTHLIRAHPELHDCPRPGCGVVFHLAREAPEMLEAAFAAGLSPDAGSEPVPGQTFLQNVAADGDERCVALALRYGAKVDRRNNRGETALGYACSWDQFGVVKLLVDAGADVNAIEHDPEDDFRSTALDGCREKPEIFAYLRAHGAKHYSELKTGNQSKHWQPAALARSSVPRLRTARSSALANLQDEQWRRTRPRAWQRPQLHGSPTTCGRQPGRGATLQRRKSATKSVRSRIGMGSGPGRWWTR
jgi:ankyrin repeat protein